MVAPQAHNLVKDIQSGGQGSSPNNLIDLNGKLIFTANNLTNGNEVWVSDGTENGTVLLKDILNGSGDSNPKEFILYKNNILFISDNQVNGCELWTSDGNSNTNMLIDLNPGNLSGQNSSIINRLVIDSTLYFSANDGNLGFELWKLDLTYLSTFEISTFQNLFFFPNPTNGKITMNLPRQFSKIKLNVENIIGQQLDSKVFLNAQIIDYDLKLPEGIYLISLIEEEKIISTFKIIKH